MTLINNVHLGLKLPSNSTKSILIRGHYFYYHYCCDGIDDNGWGCGYRTLQTICSWVKEQQKFGDAEVPTIYEVQKSLVDMGDKDESFLGSKNWIGSLEVAYVLDHFYKIECRILHFRCIKDLENQISTIKLHFEEYGSPIMMGGDKDCSSKCILGVCDNEDEIYLLILDPHYFGRKKTCKEELQEKEWIKWREIKSLDPSSFYNLCCPLIKAVISYVYSI